jgi:cellulose synthase/poly-beta-1,6-N-acetylglucosamine synthase-like glycosyltransferase
LHESLNRALHENAPRFTTAPTPPASLLIHGAVLLLWLGLLGNIFLAHGIFTWSAGLVYIGYDTLLLGFTAWQTWPLRRNAPPPPTHGPRPTLAVVVAAFNEAAVLPATIAALRRQSEPPEEIIIADDGSTDATAPALAQFGLETPPLGGASRVPGLTWLRLPHGGKARALNQALPHINSEIFLTVDADTQLDPGALAAMRDAFADTPGLVAATGVLTPACDASPSGRILEWFQTYEYVRNFLSRYAWAQTDSLLLISGAFAGFRRAAVQTVGGFDPDCLVEDYELIHRLRRHGYNHNLGWHSTALGAARAQTAAPATIPAFLRQRRRWFGGFLQTQFWYRDMVGNPKYEKLGLWMLPVKAVDTLQPLYGLLAFGLLLSYILTGRTQTLIPVGSLILGKICLDLAFHIWSIHLYRNWTGGQTKLAITPAIAAAIIEPFSFQLLRHLGATLGWLKFLTGNQTWGTQHRTKPNPAS